VFLVVTYGEPCSRLPLLLQPCYGWHVTLYVMGNQLDKHLTMFPTQLSPIIYGPVDAHTLVRTGCSAWCCTWGVMCMRWCGKA
jgi:hypothetical protein